MRWQERAVCRTKHQAEAWFPPNRAGAGPAREVCVAECKVREQCARWAFDAGERSGVWGGYALPWETQQLARFVGAEAQCATFGEGTRP
uniref:WhiB family transcriptional regulator n=1 Tax=Nocardia suismassiliense TaxID=2077092 RepID=UPI003F498A27